MDRRVFLDTLAGGLLTAPLSAEAQQAGKLARIGVLYPGGAAPLAPRMEAFRQGLRDHGYVEGTTIAIDVRYADGRPERLPQLAAELVQRNASVIATSGDRATREKGARWSIECVGIAPPRVLQHDHHRPRGKKPAPSDLPVEGACGGRRLDLLWSEPSRNMAANRPSRGQGSEGCQAC